MSCGRGHGAGEELGEGLVLFGVGEEAGDEGHRAGAEAEAEAEPPGGGGRGAVGEEGVDGGARGESDGGPRGRLRRRR